MSLRHGLLGLLAERSASGYDLARSFEEKLSPWAWHAGHSQIYPELRRMLAEGLVEVDGLHARRRRSYAVTAAGRAALRRWLLGPPAEEKVRSTSTLRLVLIGALEPDEAREVLLSHADDAERRLDALLARMGRGDTPSTVGRLADERGLHVLPAVRDWARRGAAEFGGR